MDDEQTVCDKCGRTILPGQWPFCPREGGEHKWTGGFAAFRDEIPGGITLENYGDKPVTFDSHSQRRAYMKKHFLNEKECWAPLPGTDKDPQGIPNPAGYIDSVTMKNREILALRAAGCKVEDDNIEGIIGDTYDGVMTEQDAIKVASGDKRRQSRLGRRLHGDNTGS